jgi:hypothetical protein
MTPNLGPHVGDGRLPFRPEAALLDLSPPVWDGEVPGEEGSPSDSVPASFLEGKP